MIMKRESASDQFKIDRRDLKQTTTAMAQRTWLNNGSAYMCILKLCTILNCPLQNTLKSPEFSGLRKETMTANCLTFHLELNPAQIQYAEVEM